MNARRLVTQSNMTARNRIDEYTTDRVLLMPCQYRILVNTEAPRRRKIIALRLIEIVNARINRFAVSGHLLGRHHAARATGAREAERESALTDAMPEPATGAPGGSFESASTIADAGNAGPPASLSMYSFSCAISCCIFIYKRGRLWHGYLGACRGTKRKGEAHIPAWQGEEAHHLHKIRVAQHALLRHVACQRGLPPLSY